MGPMRLFAAVAPPQEVREELSRLIADVAPGTNQLEPVDADSLMVFVCRFGNVTLADQRKLTHSLLDDIPSVAGGELHVKGGTALEWPGDMSLWAKLEGDLDALAELARCVPASVKPLGFFVDRRAFHPWISVGEITDTTTAPYLESVIKTLDGYEGPSWRFDSLLLCRWTLTEDLSYGGFEVLEEIGLLG
jgi:2'-5' RNA ligase